MRSLKKINISALVLFIVLVASNIYMNLSLWWYVFPIVLWFLIMALGSFSLSWNFYLEAITNKENSSEKKVAITFDDGPHPKYTLEVLKILESYQAKATFFCIGRHIQQHPEVLKAISKKGHAIGNHSFSHDVLIDFNSSEEWVKDIKRTDQLIYQVLGKKTELFRPPFGVTTPKLAKALQTTKHKVIGWNIRSFDTVLQNPERIVKNISRQIQPGAVILLHDKQKNVLPVLEYLLQFLYENDYKTLTIHELFHDQ